MPVTVLVRPDARGLLAPDELRVLGRRTAARLRLALRALGRARAGVALVFTGDVEIRELNRRFRGIDRATDVLSFHLVQLSGEDDPGADGQHLGDVVISLRTARRRAPGRRLARELETLAVHGLCHLLGHDHARPAQARRMFALQRRLLRLRAAQRQAAPVRRRPAR